MDATQIALIVVTVLLLVAGGYIRKLAKEIKDFVTVCHEALEDGKVSPDELANIIKEAKDVKNAVLEITQVIVRKK